MSGFSFGASSLKNLEGVHPLLVSVVKRALEISRVDFKVIEGVRTKERQKVLYAQGRTTPGPVVTWTLESNHFINPVTGFGHAVDLLPAPYDWKAMGPFKEVSEAMFQAAKELGVSIRWGLDWDMDGVSQEKGETDAPPFELTKAYSVKA